MKKFLKYILLFFLPILIAGFAGEILLRNIPNDYNAKREYLDQHADSIQLLFLGSSHTECGINPRFISKPGFNAAFSSQSLDLDYEIILKYDQQWKDLKVIVVPISYFSLFEKLNTGPEHWRINYYIIYFKMKLSDKISNHSEMIGNKLWYNLYRMYNYYAKGQSEQLCSELGWRNRPIDTSQTLEASGKKRAVMHTIKNQDCFDENVQTLQSIIEYAAKKNIKVLFYTPPAYQSYRGNLDKSQWEKTRNTIHLLTDKYKNTTYTDFLSDSTFVSSDYSDADHLNESGAKKLTTKIDSILLSLMEQ